MHAKACEAAHARPMQRHTLTLVRELQVNLLGSRLTAVLSGRNNINMEENDVMLAAEPAAALLSEEVRRSGILSQVMKLSQPDKVALIAYLKRGMETEEPFKTDEFGRIKLTKEMRDAAMKAERDYEDGKCLTEADFKERFAKWL